MVMKRQKAENIDASSAESPLIFAYALQKGPSERLAEKQAVELIRSDAPAWAYLDSDHPKADAWLKKNVDYMPAVIRQALLEQATRPRAEQIDNGVMLILRGVNMNEGAEPEDMISLRCWIDPSRMLVMRRRPVRATKKIAAAMEAGKGPEDAGAFLLMLLETLLDIMEPVFTTLEDELDALEEELIENPHSLLRNKVSRLRRRALMLRRYINPQRDAISGLRSMQLDWLSATDTLNLHEEYDRITRFIEQLDAIRERCQIVQDELATILADKLNRNTYILTVVAAIFLPLGFITGLLGINVGGMPGVDDAQAFTVVSFICLGIFAMQLLVFKKLKWF